MSEQSNVFMDKDTGLIATAKRSVKPDCDAADNERPIAAENAKNVQEFSDGLQLDEGAKVANVTTDKIKKRKHSMNKGTKKRSESKMAPRKKPVAKNQKKPIISKGKKKTAVRKLKAVPIKRKAKSPARSIITRSQAKKRNVGGRA